MKLADIERAKKLQDERATLLAAIAQSTPLEKGTKPPPPTQWNLCSGPYAYGGMPHYDKLLEVPVEFLSLLVNKRLAEIERELVQLGVVL